MSTPDLGFLRDVQHGIYWRQLDGEWRHNTRDLTDTEAIQLGVWADCRPGGTAHLNEKGWDLLDGPTPAITPADPVAEPDGPLSAISKPISNGGPMTTLPGSDNASLIAWLHSHGLATSCGPGAAISAYRHDMRQAAPAVREAINDAWTDTDGLTADDKLDAMAEAALRVLTGEVGR